MVKQIAKVLLLVALLTTFVASSAPAFAHAGDHDFCDFTGLAPTNCLLRADGSCYTQKCDNPFFNCVYSFCSKK